MPAVAATNGPAGNAYFGGFSCCCCWHKQPTTTAVAGPATAATTIAEPATVVATSWCLCRQQLLQKQPTIVVA